MHDLFSQMKRLSQNMSHDYQDIQNRLTKTENTAVAGDLAENVWVKMLSEILPERYKVFKNGTIISRDGRTSPEIDILVVKGEHPPHLLEQKMFLEAGVAAAFECKLTLRASDIKKFLEVCKDVKSLSPDRFGTPYKELQTPIICGLLAFSHSWKKKSPPEKCIVKEFNAYKSIEEPGWHPRDFIDLIVVANLNAWAVEKLIFYSLSGENPIVNIGYNGILCYHETAEIQTYSILGFIVNLIHMLAREDTSLRDLAEYYRSALSDPPGSGRFPSERLDFSMNWDYASVLSEHVCNAISTNNFEQETRIVDESGTKATYLYGEWTGVR